MRRYTVKTLHPTAAAEYHFMVCAKSQAHAYVVAHEILRDRHGADHFHMVDYIAPAS